MTHAHDLTIFITLCVRMYATESSVQNVCGFTLDSMVVMSTFMPNFGISSVNSPVNRDKPPIPEVMNTLTCPAVSP